MEFDIIQITQRISVGGSAITPGWPAFANWLSTQVPRRKITGYHEFYRSRNQLLLLGWSDQWKSDGNTRDSFHKKEFEAAVLSTEIIGVLEAPPLSLSNRQESFYRNT